MIKPINFFYILFGISFIITGCNDNGKLNSFFPEAGATESGEDTFFFRPLSQKERDTYKKQLGPFHTLLLGANFSGSVLVAKNGEIVFENHYGQINQQTGEPVTQNTQLHLASISKTFTGTTILRLWEQGRLSLDDRLQKYFPQLLYQGITIRMLLSHRSGLPNYLNFLDTAWNKKKKATNSDVLNFMITKSPIIVNKPDVAFNYSNTNYVLLALIIEKITGLPFPKYMKDSVFIPFGLEHTYVFSNVDTSHYIPTYAGDKPYPMDHFDCIYGDKNIYSTVRDMLLWDKALYQYKFVTKATLDTAFKPLSFERPSMHNYGLGWRLLMHNNDTIVYHNGKWHGSNTVFTRLVQDTATIIILGNRYNRNIYRIGQAGNVFFGKNNTIKLEE